MKKVSEWIGGRYATTEGDDDTVAGAGAGAGAGHHLIVSPELVYEGLRVKEAATVSLGKFGFAGQANQEHHDDCHQDHYGTGRARCMSSARPPGAARPGLRVGVVRDASDVQSK